jgi:hypothetical protein
MSKALLSAQEKPADWLSIESIAHHEAGHAVAAYLTDTEFEYVTIEPNDRVGGHVRLILDTNMVREHTVFQFHYPDGFVPTGHGNSLDINIDPRVRSFVESGMLISAAGNAAQQLFHQKWFGGFEWNSGTSFNDMIAFMDLAETVTGSEAECTAYMEWMEQRTWNLMAVLSHRRAVRALANALVKSRTIEYERAIRVIKTSFNRSRGRAICPVTGRITPWGGGIPNAG